MQKGFATLIFVMIYLPVPIIPAYLYELRHQEDIKMLIANETHKAATSTETVMLSSSQSPTEDSSNEEQISTTPDLRELCEKSKAKDENSDLESNSSKKKKQKSKNRKPQSSTVSSTVETATEELITTLSPAMKERRHHELVNENVEVGVMFASKPIVQAITNPFIGPLTNKYVSFILNIYLKVINFFSKYMSFLAMIKRT